MASGMFDVPELDTTKHGYDWMEIDFSHLSRDVVNPEDNGIPDSTSPKMTYKTILINVSPILNCLIILISVIRPQTQFIFINLLTLFTQAPKILIPPGGGGQNHGE